MKERVLKVLKDYDDILEVIANKVECEKISFQEIHSVLDDYWTINDKLIRFGKSVKDLILGECYEYEILSYYKKDRSFHLYICEIEDVVFVMGSPKEQYPNSVAILMLSKDKEIK